MFSPSTSCALVLAGGASTRFNGNKLIAQLLPRQNAVDLTVKHLTQFGIAPQDIIIVVSPSIQKKFSSRYSANTIVVQTQALGNGDAAAQALPEINKRLSCRFVLITQGDDSFTYDSADYRRLYRALSIHNADIAVFSLDSRRQWDKSTQAFWHAACNQRRQVLVQGIIKGTDTDKVKTLKRKAKFFEVITNTMLVKKEILKFVAHLKPNPLEKNEKVIPDFLKQVQEHRGTIITVPTTKYLGFNDRLQFNYAQKMIARYL